MRFAALIERTSSGWTAWIPALPEVRAEAATAAAAEEAIALALERHLHEQRARGAFPAAPEIRAFSVDVRTRAPGQAPPATDADRLRLLASLDAVLSDGAFIPRAVLDTVFRFRRELLDSLPDAPDALEDLPPNVVPFSPRES